MKKTYVISMLAVFAVLFAVLMSFVGIRVAEQKMPHIELPDEQDAGGADSDLELLLGEDAPASVEITDANVLDLIASLERPSEYSAEVYIYLYWDGGSSLSRRSIWTKDGVMRVECTQNGGTQVSLVYDDYTYIWQKGEEERCYRGSTAAFNADSAAGVPTYENIGAGEGADILACGSTVLAGRSCLWVQTSDGNSILDWYVDLESGLLCRMEQSSGGVLTRRTDIALISEDGVSDSYFELPEGVEVTD